VICTGTLSGVAAGLAATILMPGSPRVGDRFAPSANYNGTVLSLDETMDSYTGVLHTRFIVDQTDNKKNQYDDYWAPGIGQVKSVWSLADGKAGHWLRVHPDFHTMQTDLKACAQPGSLGETARIDFSRKYNLPLSKLDPFGVPNMSPGDWGKAACIFELEWLPGAIVWRIRADMDGWKYRDCGSVDDYCYRHAYACNHWQWYQGCLESKLGSFCFNH
jgi:hypothetical protein